MTTEKAKTNKFNYLFILFFFCFVITVYNKFQENDIDIDDVRDRIETIKEKISNLEEKNSS